MSSQTRDRRRKTTGACSLMRTWLACFGGSSNKRSLNQSKAKKAVEDTVPQRSDKDADSSVVELNVVLSGRTIQLGGQQRRRTLSFCSSTLSFDKTSIVKEACEQAMKGISPHIFTDLINVNQCMLLNLMVPAASSSSSLRLSPSPGFLRER